MTVVHMSEGGQILVPKDIREKHGFSNGSAFAVSETKSGHLVLRPMKSKPRASLVEQLRKFKGLEIPSIRVHCPPRL